MYRRMMAATAVLGLALAGASAPASAQEVRGLAVEVRGGFNMPIGDFSDRGAESEAGYAADLIVNLSPAVSVYGGWAKDQFGCDCPDAVDLWVSGPELGVKLLAMRSNRVLPWARVGVTYHELGGEAGGLDVTSDRGIGIQASLGVDIPLGEVLSVSPALRYQGMTADFNGPFDVFTAQQQVRFLSLDIGAHFHLR